MKTFHSILTFVFFITAHQVMCQQKEAESMNKTRLVFGISVPELIHAGINLDFCQSCQLGINAGIGPSWGTVWPQIGLEQRIYFGKLKQYSGRKAWFTRQGINYFPLGDEGTLTISLGKELKSQQQNRGWTIDVGISTFVFWEDEPKHKFFPALRVQYYFYL